MRKQVFNPFLPLNEYIPDGEPHVFGNRVYLYGSHDKEAGDTFCMRDYCVYSASITDLKTGKSISISSCDYKVPLAFVKRYAQGIIKITEERNVNRAGEKRDQIPHQQHHMDDPVIPFLLDAGQLSHNHQDCRNGQQITADHRIEAPSHQEGPPVQALKIRPRVGIDTKNQGVDQSENRKNHDTNQIGRQQIIQSSVAFHWMKKTKRDAKIQKITKIASLQRHPQIASDYQ